MTTFYVDGCEPVSNTDSDNQPDADKSGVSGTTHKRKTTKEAAHSRIKALRAGLGVSHDGQ
jgi:hypothetical protein